MHVDLSDCVIICEGGLAGVDGRSKGGQKAQARPRDWRQRKILDGDIAEANGVAREVLAAEVKRGPVIRIQSALQTGIEGLLDIICEGVVLLLTESIQSR